MAQDPDVTVRVSDQEAIPGLKQVPKLRRRAGDVHQLLGADPKYTRFGKDAIDGETDIGSNYILHANLGTWKDPRKLPPQEDRVVRAEFITADGKKATRFAVGDGMTGPGGGNVAAELFADAIAKPQSYAAAEAETMRRLEEKSVTNETLRGAGVCTAVATIVGNTLHRNRRGDARIYVFSKEGTLKSLTRDENVYYGDRPTADSRASEQAALRSATEYPRLSVKNSMVTNDLSLVNGTKPENLLEPIELEEGDVVFVCSDGVSDNATGPEIWAALKSGHTHALPSNVRAKMDGGHYPFHLDQSVGGSKGIAGKADNFAYAAYVHGRAPTWWPKPKTYGDQLRRVLGL